MPPRMRQPLHSSRIMRLGYRRPSPVRVFCVMRRLSLCVSPLRAVIRRRLDFVVAVHGLQGRLRLAIARLELGPRGLCRPSCCLTVWERAARPPASPSAAHATLKSSLGATPSGLSRTNAVPSPQWKRASEGTTVASEEDACSSSRRNPLRLVAAALEEDACSSSRRSPLRLVAVALEEDAALATHPAAPVPPVGHPGAGRRAPLCPVAP